MRILFGLISIHLFVSDTFQQQSYGGISSNNHLESIVDGHITRLMSLRHTDWGWHNTPEAILAIQLSKPHSFFGRDQAVAAMKQEYLAENRRSSLGKLALYAMALRSVCENPRNFSGNNILQSIQEKLDRLSRQQSPRIQWYSYALAIQALCVNDVTVAGKYLRMCLEGQNGDGSYGTHSSVDSTAQMLIALKCTSMQPHNASGRKAKKIKNAINRGVKFFKKMITNTMHSAWIGNKYSTPLALSALHAVDRNLNARKHNKIVNSLKSCDPDVEPEAAVTQRLPALRSVTAIDLITWNCTVATVPIPPGYSPSGESPSTAVSIDDFLFSLDDVTIDVTLTVNVNDRNSTVLVEGVQKDDTLLQVMEQATLQTDFTFAVKDTSWGPSLVELNGLAAEPSLRQYWSLVDANSGRSLSVGVGQYQPSHNDHILFRLTSY